MLNWELLQGSPFNNTHSTLSTLRSTDNAQAGLPERVRRLTLEITKYCDIGCSFCKYHVRASSSRAKNGLILSGSAINECLRYCRANQVPALVITGGGEPTYELDTVLRLIRDSSCRDISLYTAGQWGETASDAQTILGKLHTACEERKSPANLEVRLSVDDFHAKRLGSRPAINIIEQYGQNRHKWKSTTLTVRTVLGYETTLSDISRGLGAKLTPVDKDHRVLSLRDGETVIPILAMNLIASGRLKHPNRQKDLTFTDPQDVWESSDKNFGERWPVMFGGGLNIGVRPSGKVYLYGGTPEDYGQIPDRTLDTITADLAKDVVNRSVYRSRWREIVDLVHAVEPAATSRLGDMSDPTAIVPQLLTDPARLLYVKLALAPTTVQDCDEVALSSWTARVRQLYKEHLSTQLQPQRRVT